MILSITEYAKRVNLTRQAILYQIKHKTLPSNVKVRKVGNIYVLTVYKKHKSI